jgi:hypothetical protein
VPAAYPHWTFYPTWQPRPAWVEGVVNAIAHVREEIDSTTHVGSNFQRGPVVHGTLKPGLEQIGFTIEGPGQRGTSPGLRRAVLHGEGAAMERWYDFDGWHPEFQIALEIEGGKAHEGRNAVWDPIKFCLVTDVRYGVVIVPTTYQPTERIWTPPYDKIKGDFDSMYANPQRFHIPLEGLLLIGY